VAAADIKQAIAAGVVLLTLYYILNLRMLALQYANPSSLTCRKLAPTDTPHCLNRLHGDSTLCMIAL
jgi:hypothetical protein